MQKLMVLRYNPDGIKYARNKILFENFIAQWRCRLYLRSKTSLFIFFMFNLFIKMANNSFLLVKKSKQILHNEWISVIYKMFV